MDGSLVEIRPATPGRWDDLADLFERRGPRGGTPFTAGCWCRYWLVRGKEYERGWGAGHRARLAEELQAGPPPGLLAYADGAAVGWCRVGPREGFERLERSRALARVDAEDVWSVVCFSVHPAWRRRGVARALLDAAAEHAAANGAGVLEAYPVHAGHPLVDSFTGHLPMFLAAGFEPVRDAGRRTVVRKRLRLATPGGRGSTP